MESPFTFAAHPQPSEFLRPRVHCGELPRNVVPRFCYLVWAGPGKNRRRRVHLSEKACQFKICNLGSNISNLKFEISDALIEASPLVHLNNSIAARFQGNESGDGDCGTAVLPESPRLAKDCSDPCPLFYFFLVTSSIDSRIICVPPGGSMRRALRIMCRSPRCWNLWRTS